MNTATPLLKMVSKFLALTHEYLIHYANFVQNKHCDSKVKYYLHYMNEQWLPSWSHTTGCAD